MVAGFVAIMIGLILGTAGDLRRAESATRPIRVTTDNPTIAANINKDIQSITSDLNNLNHTQEKLKLQVFDIDDARQATATAEVEVDIGDFKSARANLQSIQNEIRLWRTTLDRAQRKAHPSADGEEVVATTPDATPKTSYSQTIPILIYHKTPTDFEHQLQVITQKGYRTTTLAEVATGLRTKRPLPGKPLVITFDDGFSDQLKAFSLLQKYSMKATFYIITGGQVSRGCIGANRTNTTCGDNYLNWDQIRMLDHSGLITIGAHTVDHLALASQPAASQEFQIRQSKSELEAQLGHSITDFAYPYGSFNSTSISLVQKAGFATSVSTLSGITQSPDWIYALRRTRTADKLL